MQACVKPRLVVNYFKLDLADVIKGKWMCCIQNLLTCNNNLCILNEYFHIAICFKKLWQSNYFLTNLTHGLSGNLMHFYGSLFLSCRWFSFKWVLILLLEVLINSSTFNFYCAIYLCNHEMLQIVILYMLEQQANKYKSFLRQKDERDTQSSKTKRNSLRENSKRSC